MKALPYALLAAGIALGVLTGCTDAQKEKVAQVKEVVRKGCQLAIDNQTLITMVASVDATALTAAQVGNVICTAYVNSQTQHALTSACSNGVAFGVCIKKEGE